MRNDGTNSVSDRISNQRDHLRQRDPFPNDNPLWRRPGFIESKRDEMAIQEPGLSKNPSYGQSNSFVNFRK